MQSLPDRMGEPGAIINGVEARGEKGNYSTTRIKFNSRTNNEFSLHTYKFLRPPTYTY